LNNAFEAEHDSAEYEAKVSKLMRHAHNRLKKENPLAAKTWDAAIRQLQKGDHYILALVPHGSGSSARTWPIQVGVILAAVGMIALMRFLLGSGGRGRTGKALDEAHSRSLSPLAQHALQALFLLAFFFAIFPQVFSKVTGWFPRVFRSIAPAQREK
jgi:hypothetical protein